MINKFLHHNLSASQADSLRSSIQGITLTAIIFAAPFTLNNLVNGRPLLGLFMVFVLAVMFYNRWNASQGRLSYKVSFLILTPMMLLFFAFSMQEQKIIGVLWSYPVLIMFYFILPERYARIANIGLLLVVVPNAWLVLDSGVALRAATTLIGVSIFCVIFIRQYNEQQLKLETQAFTDVLTGLSNRVKLSSTLDDVIELGREADLAISVLSLDLDQFKRINDNFGHDSGDKVLASFGQVLREQTRETDHVFRIGGEEFLVLLVGLNTNSAIMIAENIHSGFSEAQPLSEVVVTTSIGVATLGSGEDKESLLRRSDEKLYSAKLSGRNCTRA